MNLPKARQSTLGFLGLHVSIGVVVLVFVLILALSPYMGGQQIGAWQVPPLFPSVQKILTWLGPLMLAGVLALFFPMWPVLKTGTPSDEDVRRWAAERGFANPYDLGIRNYEQCRRDLGYQPMKKLKPAN